MSVLTSRQNHAVDDQTLIWDIEIAPPATDEVADPFGLTYCANQTAMHYAFDQFLQIWMEN